MLNQAVRPALPILFVSEIYAITYRLSIEILSAIPLNRHEALFSIEPIPVVWTFVSLLDNLDYSFKASNLCIDYYY